MQNMTSEQASSATQIYRERLSPSLWVLAAAAVVAPMTTLVVVPIDTTVALVLGVLIGVAVVATLVVASPVVSVTGTVLRAGRAWIDVSELGEPRPARADQARAKRGPELDVRAWHLIRGGIDGLVEVPVTDTDDPASAWVISTRTPDRLTAAIVHAQRSNRS